MRKIQVDRPKHGEKIGCAYVFEGWTVSPESSEEVAISINGNPVRYYRIDRPDVVKDYPKLHAKGFMFFFEPSSAAIDYRAEFALGDTFRELGFGISEDEQHNFAATRAIFAEHRAFLKKVLACPKCHSAIDLDRALGRIMECSACHEKYDCTGGPDLIPESYANKAEIRFQGAICSHGYDREVEEIITRVAASGGMVLDCGAGWRQKIRPNVITMEILRYPSTDVVGVGEYLPFADGAFDAVISLHVLEHVKNPFICASELIRVLKPGGTLYVVTPYIVGVHGFPFHFFNPTPFGLRALFEGKVENTDIAVPRIAHPMVALKELLAVYARFFDAEARVAFRAMTIGALIDKSSEDILSGDLTKSFAEEGKDILSSNYRLVCTKA